MPPTSRVSKGHWTKTISRSSFFLGALLLHLIVFFMAATLIIFPPFHPPADDFVKTYLPPASAPPPPPPPPQETVQVPTHPVSAPATIIQSAAPSVSFNVPMPDIVQAETPVTPQQSVQQKPTTEASGVPPERLAKIADTEKSWGRDRNNILESNSDPKNVVAEFPVYLASYANGDWGCNTHFTKAGKIDAGALPDLVAKINEWSKGHIHGEVIDTPLNIGGPDLLDKKPPFIFFTGHKDFTLTDTEIQNLRDYLQIGGAIWGDNALAGRGSRFDVAFRREMKRVVPDLDKNFQPLPLTAEVYAKSWFDITEIPAGMNYYAEPLEHLDIDGKLAIIYTPNDYSDMFYMRILPGDTTIQGERPDIKGSSPLFTNGLYLRNRGIFFRNFTLPSSLACQQLGMNIIGYMLVRFDKDLQLSP